MDCLQIKLILPCVLCNTTQNVPGWRHNNNTMWKAVSVAIMLSAVYLEPHYW